MAKLTIAPEGVTVEVSQGETLLAAILSAGLKIGHACDGNARCGTCHIRVQDGRRGLSKVGREEDALLDAVDGVGPRSRLACQTKVLGTENIKVELPG